MSTEKYIAYCIKIYDYLSKYDNEVSKLYHKIEFKDKTNRQFLSSSKSLKRVLGKRRKIKEEISKIQSLLQKSQTIEQLRQATAAKTVTKS